jgi:hypothetical protein
VTNHPNRNRTARAERIVDVVLAEFGQAVIRKISMRDAMVAACAAALIDRNRPAPHDPTNPFAPTERHDSYVSEREDHQTPCLSALASGAACQPDETLKRCAICGFVVDTKFTTEKPTVRMRP